jgi:hypothetical protein
MEGIFGMMFVSSDYSGATTLTQITLKFTIIFPIPTLYKTAAYQSEVEYIE